MLIVPDSSVSLYADVPISDGHEIVFRSKTEQSTYFATKRIASKAGCAYLKKTGRVRIDWSTETVMRADFISFKNPSFENITLDSYQNWHPYMQQRKLSKNVCEKFDIKYDPKSECIVFPVKDVKGKLKFLTRRSIKSKKFIIDKDIDKEVYLLYNIIKEGVKEVIVTESQINCLTCWSYNLPSIALLGTGTEYQYELLKKSGIIHYILCFDGDEAGRKGRDKFIKNLGDNVFITVVNLPEGKDVNDLNKEEFIQLLDESGLDYNNLVTKYLNLSKGD